jgi:DNA-binding transcriptional MerR regulator
MSARSYLSIGDVLTLLRQEFQDITISKIRFLESQGLVNPERTPSGYRKFYEHDVERLRWVLRQQREHFLPLKVIKDRLDDGSDAAGTDRKGTRTAAPASGAGDPEQDSAKADRSRAGDPVLVGHRVRADSEGRPSPTSAHPAGDGPLSVVEEGSALPGIGAGTEFADEPSVSVRTGAASSPGPSSLKPTRSAGSARRGTDRGPVLELLDDGTSAGSKPPPGDPANGSDEGPVARRGAGAATSGPVASSSVPTGPGSPRAGSAEPAPEAPVGAGPNDPGSGPEPEPATRPAPSPRAAKSRGKPGGRAPAGPPPARSAPSAASSGAGGTNLSAEELAAASGLDLTVVMELQEYGLLAPSTMAGVEYFDEEALAVATVAAGFTRFGIEPRHLRLYKNAAEREAGFVEQVVLPLVRQRNPEARARAHETAEELAQLGQQLRGSLLRTALGNLLNG